jgi:hypothetical protein
MVRAPVDSTSLASVGYSPEHSVLEVEFRNGRIYRYFTVPAKVYEQLMAAESKGSFVNRFIRDVFPYAGA